MTKRCLGAITRSIGQTDSVQRVDLIISEKIKKFFNKCLDLILEISVDRLETIDRITVCLVVVLSEAEAFGLAIDLIERMMQRLVSVVIDNEQKANDSLNIKDISYVVKCLTDVAIGWFKRNPDPAIPTNRHTNWMEESLCSRRLAKVNTRLNEIYSDVEFSAIHSSNLPVYHQQMVQLQLVMKLFRDKFRVHYVQYMAIHYRRNPFETNAIGNNKKIS